MGQKTSPIGFRLVINKKWKSNWFGNKNEFGILLLEDRLIRNFLYKQPCCVGTSDITIKRMSEKIEVTLHTARPGLVIGKRGAGIDILKQDLKRLTGKDIWIEVSEIKRPDLDAKLVARGIATQIKRRMPFRRILKKAGDACMQAGALGVKVMISGRLQGADIAREESYKEGTISLHTLRENIDYGTDEAHTTYGVIGIKVWINKGNH